MLFILGVSILFLGRSTNYVTTNSPPYVDATITNIADNMFLIIYFSGGDSGRKLTGATQSFENGKLTLSLTSKARFVPTLKLGNETTIFSEPHGAAIVFSVQLNEKIDSVSYMFNHVETSLWTREGVPSKVE